MGPVAPRVALTVHVATSVGWLGAGAAFLALAVAGLAGGDAERVRAACVAMEVTGWWVIVPLCLASLVTGVVQSLGTAWGLFRHYWVAIKLLLTVLSTVVLLIHMRPISHVAGVALVRPLATGDLRAVRVQLTVDAGAAFLVLLVTTALSVVKPRGSRRTGTRCSAGDKRRASKSSFVSERSSSDRRAFVTHRTTCLCAGRAHV
jgi:hypothetical protein